MIVCGKTLSKKVFLLWYVRTYFDVTLWGILMIVCGIPLNKKDFIISVHIITNIALLNVYALHLTAHVLNDNKNKLQYVLKKTERGVYSVALDDFL